MEDAKDLLSLPPRGERDERGEVNELQKRTWFDESVLVSERPFEVAAEHMGSEKILQLVGQWIEEDRVGSLIKVVDSPRSSVQDIKAALRLFRHHGIEDDTLRDTTRDGLRTSLIRRLLSDDSRYIEAARKHLSLVDFDALLERLILPPGSYGKLGGKASGLFLAQRIIEQSGIGRRLEAWGTVTAPKTFFLATDAQMHLVQYNEFQGILEQVYRDIDEVRDQHSNIEQMFRSAVFPPDIINSLSMVLDEMGNAPLIVRSSSLLEDSYGMAFSGKYESLFLSNQGSKRERLAELLDGISEVYASVFGPDAIAYRRERGLMCVIEEMGILIQEVVGRRIGDYFLPAFSGVAFTNNEFRWSPRIERRDGLIRLVPGLGTRAVDRVADDYPVLIVPSRPEMKANAKVKDTVRYAPRKIDVLNLKSRHFETLDLADFVEEKGDEIPWIGHVFSIFKEGTLRPASPLLCDPRRDTLVATFEGLINRTAFVKTIRSILDVLENALDTPVDIEFACDGERVYLLQCRPQSNSDNSGPAVIPRDISTERLIFSANRFVSNGHVAPISHIVYVVPEEYRLLGSREEMLEVGKAVGELNKILPKRQFVLMGPGRWGSRGDITLGVPVTYADICNVSVLIEIARRQGGYVPDLSFGTHFFQDLVESNIRYLPLYPDEEENAFNEIFLASSENIFAELVPAYSHLDKVIKVIDVPASSDGSVLRVLCNAELDMAVGMLALPEDTEFDEADSRMMPNIQRTDDRHWQWRMRNVSKLAKVLDYERFGVVAVYVFGSTKNASAGPGSDIDLLFHVRNKPGQQRELEHWIDGWSHALGEANYLRTGYEVGPLIDAHYVCDEDFECKDSYATKIGAVTDAARLVPREDDSK
ncbi:MAG: nucleotidyltransferase domain-containing protein [Deltaproteobacteria bacterium]|nr:nucleotidyltransferase domain-containing protein [Deltaproteobacteria bacterium]